MQFFEYIIKIFRMLFGSDSFKRKYRTKSIKFLFKIINKENSNWIIIDIRNFLDYKNSTLKSAINIPYTLDGYSIYKKIDKSKKILIFSNNHRSYLKFYKFLDDKNLKPYILFGSYEKDILNDEKFANFLIKS